MNLLRTRNSTKSTPFAQTLTRLLNLHPPQTPLARPGQSHLLHSTPAQPDTHAPLPTTPCNPPPSGPDPATAHLQLPPYLTQWSSTPLPQHQLWTRYHKPHLRQHAIDPQPYRHACKQRCAPVRTYLRRRHRKSLLTTPLMTQQQTCRTHPRPDSRGHKKANTQ